MDPAALTVPLLVGAVCFITSMGVLWRNARRVLGVLSALLGAVLCLGGLCSLTELGRFLPLGLLCGAVAFAALRPRKPVRASAFDRAAEHLLRRNAAIPSVESVRAVFSDTGMSIGPEPPGEAVRSIPYSDFELVLETRDLILPVCDESMVVLQKKDLLTGTLSQLRELLGEQVLYVRVSEQAEAPS